MAIDPGRVKFLFQAAIERDDPAARRAYLEGEIGDDVELRARLDALLAAYDRPPAALDRPLGADLQATVDADLAAAGDSSWSSLPRTQADGPAVTRAIGEGPDLLGAVIAGRYKIRQAIGEGGMGSVYLAEQTRPVRRMVALKLIKPGMDSRTVLARFEAERQALALMDHPNIARVLDAGTTDQGRPFFIMELVKGVPLTDYCDRHRLGLPERLALFRQICSAVQHAHQKGVIHRDLKPTNILVESHDDRPVPKVIDFGLAKATSGMQLTEHSLFTAFGGVTGTPLYMAPEQATFNALDVDTRADIYALGVILYELLTGSTPIRRETVQRAALDEMLRVIREDEPPPPSSRISSSEGLPTLAANRHVEPGRLGRLVRGDLDWIVMKALAKERDRRYDSAIGLANDVERFLAHEPVTAGPPGAAYRVRKFVRRHRGRVAAAALILLALVGGVVGTTLGLIEARRQERRARSLEKLAVAEANQKEKARRAEAEQRAQADDQRRRAEKRLGQVSKMNDILGSIFRDLNPSNAEKEGKPLSAILGERLDRATAEIEGEATGDPLAVARMQVTLGGSLLALGYAERAIPLYTKARATFAANFGPDAPNTLRIMGNLADSYYAAGRRDRALRLNEETLALCRAKLGPGHPDTLRSMSHLAADYNDVGQIERALALREEALALYKAKLGPGHPDTLKSMLSLAISYGYSGQIERGLKLNEEALVLYKAKLGPDHPDTLLSMNNLAASYDRAGRSDEAQKLSEEVLALRRAKLGPDHPDTLWSMNNVACGYALLGQKDRAIKLYEETLALRRAKLGPDHPDTLNTALRLAWQYQLTGQTDRALRLIEEVVPMQTARLGPDHPETIVTRLYLTVVLDAAGQHDRALKNRVETLALQKAKLGPDHLDILWSLIRLADRYDDSGQRERSLEVKEEALPLRKARFGPDHPETILSTNGLAIGYRDTGRPLRALPFFEEVLARRKARLGPDHPETLMALTNLAECSRPQANSTGRWPCIRRPPPSGRRRMGPIRGGISSRRPRSAGACSSWSGGARPSRPSAGPWPPNRAGCMTPGASATPRHCSAGPSWARVDPTRPGRCSGPVTRG